MRHDVGEPGVEGESGDREDLPIEGQRERSEAEVGGRPLSRVREQGLATFEPVQVGPEQTKTLTSDRWHW